MEDNRVAVIYKSRYGSTKKYAQKIASLVHGDLFDRKEVKFGEIPYYNTIAFAGSIYAGRISGADVIAKNMDKIEDKKIAVIAVGMSKMNKEAIDTLFKNNFNEEQLKNINCFYLRGALDINKLNFFDKLIMKLMKKKVQKNTQSLTDDQKEFIALLENPYDWTDKEDINHIIDYINS